MANETEYKLEIKKDIQNKMLFRGRNRRQRQKDSGIFDADFSMFAACEVSGSGRFSSVFRGKHIMRLNFALFGKGKLAFKGLLVLTIATISFYQIQQAILNLTIALNGAPSITSISPNSGSVLGGQTATITGTNFMANEVMFKQVSAGSNFSLAIDVDGYLWGWGNNSSSQLGNGNNTASNVPINISAIAGNPVQGVRFQAVAAGAIHSLAIDVDGNLWTWGNNFNGQLGNGNNTASNIPINISAIAGNPVQNIRFQAVAGAKGNGSDSHSVAVDTNGNLWAWGYNGQGQLGNNSTSNSNVPINLSSIASGPVQNLRFQNVAAGFAYSLAVDTNGNLWSWGNNSTGQLGNNSTTQSNIPVNISAISGNPAQGILFSTVTAGGSGASNHSLAIDANGNLWAWGSNINGQLGNNSISSSNVPINLSALVTLTGGVTNPIYNTRFQAIAVGYVYSLAIDTSGNLWAWGSNGNGQLGNNSTTQSNVPINISAIAGNPVYNLSFQSIAAGNNYSLAVGVNGGLWAWGSNGSSQLGDGSTNQSNVPIQPQATATPYSVVTGVKFGRFDASFTVNSDTSITVTVPQGSVGTVDVSIESPRGLFTLPNAYTYLLPDPTITSVSPDSGSTDGGDAVTVTGTNFMVQQEAKYSQVAAGSNHSLAIDASGNLWTWGNNGAGQLGNNNAGTNSAVPINISAISGNPVNGIHFQAIAAGINHSLAIDTDGNLWAWGINTGGQLGNGNNTQSPVPINLSSLAGNPVQDLRFQVVTAGGSHSLAIDINGNLWVWGFNGSGQLGDNNAGTNSNVPINLSILSGNPVQGVSFQTNFSDNQTIAAGFTHSLAIDTNGNLWTWGENDVGQLGNGNNTQSPVPINISAISGNPVNGIHFQAIAAGQSHSLAIDVSDNLWTWGSNSNGQLGNNNAGTNSNIPVNLSALVGNPVQGVSFQSVTAKAFYSLAIDINGNLWVWGQNDNGQLGNNGTIQSPIPINLSTLASSPVQGVHFRAVAAGNAHSLTIDTNGNLWSWGNNGAGQLGNGSAATQSTVPINLSTFVSTSIYGINFRTISAGVNFSLAIDTNGNLWTWGQNTYGQLGNNSTTDSPVPINLSSLAGNPVQNLRFQAIASGQTHSLAIDTDGNLWSWGDNTYGRLGNNSTTQSSVPINLSSLAGNPVQNLRFQQVAADGGSAHSLAIDVNGNLWSWGFNTGGQLGNNSTTDSPVPINLSSLAGNPVQNLRFQAIATGGSHSIAIDVNGRLWVWGNNTFGQIGNNNAGTNSNVPVNLSSPATLTGGVTNPVYNTRFQTISAGNNSSLAIDVDGNLWVWGGNGNGQLGNNSTTQSNIPINLSSLSGSPVQNLRFQAITGGSGSYSLAIDTDGNLWAWGNNGNGRLGNNSTTQSNIPINLSSLSGNPAYGVRFQAVTGDSAHSLAISTNGNLWSWGSNSNGQLGTGCLYASLCAVPALTVATWTDTSIIDFLTFGGIDAASFAVNSATSIAAVTPSHSAGAVDVTVVSSSGGVGTLTSGYTYVLELFINVTLDTNDLEIDITPTPVGVASSKSQTLSFETNSPTGAIVSISTSTASNNMVNVSDSSKNITPIAGTMTSPLVLVNNTWGFALANASTNIVNGFDVSYSLELNNSSPTSRWAAVPGSASPLIIKSTNAPNPTTPNDTEVYFGARADTALPAGLYTTVIVYTVVENL